jgi:putative ABC transport system permease protein
MGFNQPKLSQRALYVYCFSGIALLILLLAIINFMNLTTARASMRAKEVGCEKPPVLTAAT